MTGTSELLNPASDYIFKQIFGVEKNKKLLLSLLNAILKGNPKITNLQLRNSELSKILEDNKTIRLDIKAEINTQEYVDIEIQIHNTGEIIERAIQSIQNMSVENFRHLSEEEIAAGVVQSYKLPKVIGIWIMGENIFRDSDEPVTELGWCRKNQLGFVTDKSRLFLIELPKFNPKTMDKKNILDLWIAFLKNPLLVDSSYDNKEIHQALNELGYISAKPEVREIYQLRMATEFGRISALNVAIENTRKEEQEKAKKILEEEQAKAQEALEQEKANAYREKIESAKSLLRANIPVEVISDSLGLSIEELQTLH